MKIINNIFELKKYKNEINKIKKVNYQQTYENIYCIHLSDKSAITFIENGFITTFVKKNEIIYECAMNIEPIISEVNVKDKYLLFIKHIKEYLNKTLYFPLVYEDSKFYRILKDNLYNYERLYTSISNHKKIGTDILEKVKKSPRVFFSNRNVKIFEKDLYIEYYTKKEIKNILLDIDKNSWKYIYKQDMTSKPEQLIYYNELVKQGIAYIAVVYTKKDSEVVAYRIDAIYNSKIHILKNSYKENFKKHSPGSYLLIYDLFKRYPKMEYVDLYGGPGLAKEMIETDRIKRFDMLYGDIEGIKTMENNRKKWDEKNYTNYLEGKSIKKVFDNKENVLAVTSCFGLGPVGKLNAIVDFAKDKYNWYAAGEQFDIGIFSKNIFKETCFTMNKEELKNFVSKYNIKYAIVVLKNKMARILKEIGVRVVYVDSLPFMWSEQDALEGKVPYNVDCYCAQKTLELNELSNRIFSKVKNLVWVNPIVNVGIRDLKGIEAEQKYVLINIGGLHSPTTDGLDYIDVVVKPLIEIMNDKKIYITTSSKSKKILIDYLKQYSNVFVETFEQDKFFAYVKKSDIFFTSPGLTTILESSLIKKEAIFLPPQNISQFYNIEYGKKVFSKYKEITWNCNELTLLSLKNKITETEKEVIEEINKRIKKLNSASQIVLYKNYLESILQDNFYENNLSKKILFNGVEQIIKELDEIIKETNK